jgi:flagellar protein FlaI
MPEFGTPRLGEDLAAVAEDHDHVARHLESFYQEVGEYPAYVPELTREYESRRPNVLYRAEEPVFVHVYGDVGTDLRYVGLEPTIRPDERDLYERVRLELLERSASRPAPGSERALERHLDELLDELLYTNGDRSALVRAREALVGDTYTTDEATDRRLRYTLKRDIAGLGPLQPVMTDDNNEDIHVIGPHECYVDHEVYGMVETNVDFGDDQQFEDWLRNLGERIDNPLTDAEPIVDATLPDGSRVSIVYSDDVSVKGSSLTIRQSEGTPLSIFQITKWGTLSPTLAAYLWLCMENEQTVFVVGETAAGKTTTLNAMLCFVPRDEKIYTAEDTQEVVLPHDNWQQLVTRESAGDDDGADVDMFDLVAAALRSRPNYVVVGEVRGEEAQMAFQAAQTGHPVVLTFHASDVVSMIQRFTGNPINVPETFMDNCDVALFQNRVKRDDEVLRRVTSVQEIEGYSEAEGGVITRQAFEWDPRDDVVRFTGRNNSHVLENQIATLLGYRDTRKIYDELDRRTEVVDRLIDAGVLGYEEVNEAIDTVQRDGVGALPIDTAGLAGR